MNMNDCNVSSWLPTVIQGIVTGLTISIILGGYTKIQKTIRRRKQIKYIRNMLSKSMNLIQQSKPFSDPEINRSATAEQMMSLRYQELRRNIDPCLVNRSDEITYDEIKQITDTFFIIDWVLNDPFFQEKRKIPELKLYRRLFDELRVIKWLNLK